MNNWHIRPHGELEQLEANLWRVVGSLDKMALKRQMVIARSGQELLIHSGICTSDEVREKIEALGTPRWLVVPNRWHRLDAVAFKERYPQLQVIAPRGAKERVEQIIAVEGDYDDVKTDDIRLGHFAGTDEREGYVVVRSGARHSIVVNDVIFNQPHLPGLFGFIYKLLGQSGGAKVTFVARRMLVTDKKRLATELRELAKIEGLRRLIPAHIEIIDSDVAEVLLDIADTLAPA